MGLSSYLTQLSFVTIVVILTILCPVITGNFSSVSTTSTSPSTPTGTTDLNSTTCNTTTDENCTADANPSTRSYTETVQPPLWRSGIVVFSIVGVLALLVVSILISAVSITVDRRYYRRAQKTYTLNRVDSVGVQIQRMSPALCLDSQVDESVEDDPVLMMPEQVMPVTAQPVSANQTTHLLTEDTPSISPCGENQATNGHYEECKFMRASAESLDRLVADTGNVDEAKVAIQSTNNAKALRYRSYSADPGSSTNQQKSAIRLYSNPEGHAKCRDAPADMKSNISTAGMDDLREADCTATPFNREESVDMYGADPPASADCKNESFIHSPSASAVVAYHEQMEEQAARDPPGKAVPNGPHVYEELKDMRPTKEATTSDEKGASHRGDCKITFPQYFQLNDRAIEDVRVAAGKPPRPGQSLPRQAMPDSLALLSTSPLDDLTEGGDNESPVIARRGTGIMAAMNRQHRMSDGALDKTQRVHEANPYNSLQRQNVPSLKPYSKLNRGPPTVSPKTPSASVYDKLKLADDCKLGQGSPFHETRL